MNEERLKILEMVSQGKISSEEGVRLLEALESDRDAEAGRAAGNAPDSYNADSRKNRPAGGSGGQGRMLRIRIEEEDGSRVNVNVPLGLLRSLGKLTSLIPRDVKDKLDDQEIDLANLDIEGILDAMSEGTSDGHLVDIDEADGDKVSIYIE
ncbi:MAG TPA: hypothetical protein DHD79_04880 [Firmicutes bacterium]|jgi:hypothetical protein|nr:hypothetical protein [Bacillota bacterium]HAW70705.1 hypothetical protein [Bacillota bacterium]HAZ20764.1 hypothetical protein [Bacillota bacterium]HBE06249.1 hypothetical protein [Bacillota bacterium]HBG44661.1 hypothetical protein [Bacillota bacterium]